MSRPGGTGSKPLSWAQISSRHSTPGPQSTSSIRSRDNEYSIAIEGLQGAGWFTGLDAKNVDHDLISAMLTGIAQKKPAKELREGLLWIATVVRTIGRADVRAVGREIAAQVIASYDAQLSSAITTHVDRIDQIIGSCKDVTQSLHDTLHSVPEALTAKPPSSGNTLQAAPPNVTDIHFTGQLPVTHPSVIAHTHSQARQLLLDTKPNSSTTHSQLSEDVLVQKANMALEMMGERSENGTFIGAHFLRNGGLLLEADRESLVASIRSSAESCEHFEKCFDGGWATVRHRTYTVVLDFVPLTHSPGDEVEIRQIERSSQLPQNTIVTSKWMKSIEHRRPGQSSAALLVKACSIGSANELIRSGVVIRGRRVFGRKLMETRSKSMHRREQTYRFFPVPDSPWTWEQKPALDWRKSRKHLTGSVAHHISSTPSIPQSTSPTSDSASIHQTSLCNPPLEEPSLSSTPAPRAKSAKPSEDSGSPLTPDMVDQFLRMFQDEEEFRKRAS